MVVKGWAVGGVGRGLGRSGFAADKGFVAVLGGGCGRALYLSANLSRHC